jgi:integrase
MSKKPLTALKVKTAGPGKLGDGRGLWLYVKPSGARSWIFRYQKDRISHEIGLGPWPEISLDQAREARDAMRKMVRDGRDPRAEKQKAAAGSPAEGPKAELLDGPKVGDYIDSYDKRWNGDKKEKTRKLWLAHLRKAKAAFGDRPIASITQEDIRKLPYLGEDDETPTEPARKLKWALKVVFTRAIKDGRHKGPNPADFDIPPCKAGERLPALPYQKIPAFMARLRAVDTYVDRMGIDRGTTVPRALEFIILTAARVGAVCSMTWGEIDFGQKIWTCPVTKMKGRRKTEHKRAPQRYPLSDRALEILRGVQPRDGDPTALVFPRKVKNLTPSIGYFLHKQMGVAPAEGTTHGFRTSFSDWASEKTQHDDRAIELAMAHQSGDTTKLTYKRGDLLQKRFALQQHWADYCGGSSNIVTLARAA